ncbi:hypothetical protein ARSEF4850_005497 [Beauveria asiatica]
MSLMHGFLAAAHDDAQRLTSARAYMPSPPKAYDWLQVVGSIEDDDPAPQQQRLAF